MLLADAEGWLNDPMGMYQREDGSYHVGYQAHPQAIKFLVEINPEN